MGRGSVASAFVIDGHRTGGVGLQLAPDDDRRNLRLLQVRQHRDVKIEPVGEHNQRFYATLQQHLQITLKTAALVMRIGEYRQVGNLIKGILDTAKDGRAIGISHVEHHQSDGTVAAAAQRLGKNIGTVTQASGRFLNFAFGRKRNIAGERSVVEHDRYRARRETAGARHIADGHGLLAVAASQSPSFSTSVPPKFAYRISSARVLPKSIAAKSSLNGLYRWYRFIETIRYN